MNVIDFLRWNLLAFIAVLALTIAIQLLTGKINMRGLLRDRRDGQLSPGRIQLLVVTLTGSLSYFAQAIHAQGGLPAPSPELLLALGGSHALYLTGKFGSAFRFGSFFNRKS